jgi:hypothetical protein
MVHPVVQTSWDQPIWITGYQQSYKVLNSNRFFAFELDEMIYASNQVLEFSFRRMITSPKGFVGM